jgi:hypothetical protein
MLVKVTSDVEEDASVHTPRYYDSVQTSLLLVTQFAVSEFFTIVLSLCAIVVESRIRPKFGSVFARASEP